jgi:class 3 adenylate cyclase
MLGVSRIFFPCYQSGALDCRYGVLHCVRPAEPERIPLLRQLRSLLTRDADTSREVRKMITVLFCNVAGSTALGERLDPESLRRVLGRYFELTREVLERHEGAVEKFIGDAVVGVFGIPRLHEDDALRAARAAVELQAILAELNRELERGWGVILQVRIGVNTGEVVTGSPAVDSALVLGDAANVAARLEQAADPGEAAGARWPRRSAPRAPAAATPPSPNGSGRDGPGPLRRSAGLGRAGCNRVRSARGADPRSGRAGRTVGVTPGRRTGLAVLECRTRGRVTRLACTAWNDSLRTHYFAPGARR